MAHEPAPAAPQRGHHILIAEDDVPLRGMLRKALTAAGYKVTEAGTGDEAREAYTRACPHVLLADLVLPGLNGQELATQCRRHCPDTTLIFMSGYREEELQRLEIRQVVFLPKPVMPRDLIITLDRLLADREA